MPPSIVLEVLKILEREIALREETRTLEQARAALASDEYKDRAKPLAKTQDDLAKRTVHAAEMILDLRDGGNRFAKELMLLARVEEVMQESHDLLARPETGPETIAAETEVIELLLQARRVNPKGGGGGGSTPGGGGGGDTDESALALIGVGAERNAQSQVRTVGHATGRSGAELPAEFRSGLDAFFNALEGGVNVDAE